MYVNLVMNKLCTKEIGYVQNGSHIENYPCRKGSGDPGINKCSKQESGHTAN